MSGATDTVDFTLLDETGPDDILLFGCKSCPENKKLTSHQLESHMRTIHQASKLTVDSRAAFRSRAKKTSV